MKRIMFLGLIFFGLTAFAQQPAKKLTDTKNDEQTIRSISKKWLELQKKKDNAAIGALFADDGVSYKLNQQPAIGPAAVKDQYARLQAQDPKGVFDWSTDRVEISASGDMAVEYGKFSATGLGPDGSGTDMGNYVTVYRKVKGTWKVVADIGNSTKPLETTK